MVVFSEEDQKEAARVLAQCFPYSAPGELLEQHIEALKDQFATGPHREITSFLHGLKSDFASFGIARRILAGDAGLLAECLRTSARLGYLLYVVGGEKYSGGYDCLQVFELLKMLAVGDMAAVEALTNRFPAPAGQGHPDTLLLCNAVYLALGKHPNPDAVLRGMESRKATKFFRSIYQCVAATLKQDSEQFLQNLLELQKGNRRQDFHLHMEKIICLEAHAMVRLWTKRNKSDLPEISDLALPWDRELYQHTQNRADAPLPDFGHISSVIDRWLKELPAKINVDELLLELKENTLKRMLRRVRVTRRKDKLNRSIRAASDLPGN